MTPSSIYRTRNQELSVSFIHLVGLTTEPSRHSLLLEHGTILSSYHLTQTQAPVILIHAGDVERLGFASLSCSLDSSAIGAGKVEDPK